MLSILLIDDNLGLLNDLVASLRPLLSSDNVELRLWTPAPGGNEPFAAFVGKVDTGTMLVVTDYDLTGEGMTGLFGSSIVGWCQQRAIPVGDFSRDNVSKLPKQPNLFELRVPNDTQNAASYIASVFRGFAWIRQSLLDRPELLAKRSPAAVLADLLGVPTMESQFALYGVRLGTTNAALLDRITLAPAGNQDPSPEEKRGLLCYIVGHLLLNSVLPFPGPILNGRALAAYVGCAESEMTSLAPLFDAAKYAGPFSEVEPLFWLVGVDDILQGLMDLQPKSAETHGELHRLALEAKLDHPLTRPECPRCDGQNGGFLCPFTRRTVCQRSDCSVGSSSWIPQGARLCRIERDFYEEWAPILGI